MRGFSFVLHSFVPVPYVTSGDIKLVIWEYFNRRKLFVQSGRRERQMFLPPCVLSH